MGNATAQSQRVASLVLGLIAVLCAILYRPVANYALVQGYHRRPEQIEAYHGMELKIIPNSMQCEDMHLDSKSGLIFASCQLGDPLARYHWWPPLGLFSMKGGQGTIVVIDTHTFKSVPLTLQGFNSTFDNHGMDIYVEPSDPSQIWIYAVNHKPNPEFPARSSVHFVPVIEVFKYSVHKPGEAVYVRSVSHPNLRTPNDILATSPSTFYATNDHFYPEGRMRNIEGYLGYLGTLGRWSDVVYVSMDTESLGRAHDTSLPIPNATEWVTVDSAVSALHTPNGLGHGNHLSPDGVMLTDAGAGILMCTTSFHVPNCSSAAHHHHHHQACADHGSAKKMTDHQPLEILTVPTGIDNPFWYSDPYPEVGFDASGYILAGGARNWDEGPDAAKFAEQGLDAPQAYGPSLVWYVRQKMAAAAAVTGAAASVPSNPSTQLADTRSIAAWQREMTKHYNDGWERKLLYQDTGRLTRGGSTAVMVGIKPAPGDVTKQAWLFVTGYFSMNVVAVKVDL
ncbi:hypothetical protein BX600DRAFT_532251 [Xylariales sp. PMI_506]|nr:hypothetical protein BX600DRAFT_532251 [Xylariales sp. PMI_506]